jgi:uncharacterized protein (TIGR02001 family)
MIDTRKLAAVCGAASVALAFLSGTALAEERKLEWSATATGTSDYVFRGISQSANDPAIQGSAGLTYGMFYVGTWASSIDFDPNAEIEIDYYAGITPKWGPVSFDFGYLYYSYPSANYIDYWELKAGAKAELLPKLTAGGTFYWTPDKAYDWNVYEGTLAYELPKTWLFTPTVSGLVGYTDFRSSVGVDYTYWNAGLALAVDNLTFDLRYWDTDAGPATCFGVPANTCDSRFVFSTTLSLP